MKPVVFAVMNHKGGVGKTATIINLADALAAKDHTKKILLIDADEQSCLKTVFAVKLKEAEGGLAAILENNIKPSVATIKVRNQIDLIPSGGRFMRGLEELARKIGGDFPNLLRQRMAEHIKSYDYVLIDMPPALGPISSMVAVFADWMLIPCAPDTLSLVGARNTIGFFDMLEKEWTDKGYRLAEILGVIPTMQNASRNLDTDVNQHLIELSERELANGSNMLRGGIVFSGIPVDTKIKTAQAQRKLLTEGFSKAKACGAYKTVADEILAEIERRSPAKKSAPATRGQEVEARV